MRDQYEAERRDRAEDLRLAREVLVREQEARRAEKSRRWLSRWPGWTR